MDLQAFIVFIGTPVFADYIISNVLDQIPAFVNLKGQVKSLLTLALAVGLGLLSYYLTQTLTPATIAQLQPVFAAIASMVTAWLAGQVQHEIIAPTLARRNARIDLFESGVSAALHQLAGTATPVASIDEILKETGGRG